MKPHVDDRLPKPPRGLKPRSRALFRAVVRDFDLDSAALEVLVEACRSLDRADEARALVDRDGLVVTDRFGQVKAHPATIIERDARGAFSRLVRELGLDPSTLPDSRPPSIPNVYDN